MSLTRAFPFREHRPAVLWLVSFALLGLALVLLYTDADQQDAGYHYLFGRWSWHEPRYLIGVWTRPLFTLIYSFPAQIGYPAAKCFTLLLSLATAWESYRLALQLRLERAAIVIPLLLFQPAYFLVFTETQTEPVFALLFVVALRLYYSGQIRMALVVVSMLILVRPEGFFIGVVWGLWMLQKSRQWPWWRRLQKTLWLSMGAIIWWTVATLMTRDPLWIVHDWPSDWEVGSVANGQGPIFWYLVLLPLIVGPLLLPPFLLGLRQLLRSKEFLPGVMCFLTLFVLHSVLFWRGWFGAAGYPRYLVCVSPAIAIVTLAGWSRMRMLTNRTVQAIVLVVSFLVCLFYVDGYRYTRDARAVEDVLRWMRSNPVSYSRLIYSQSYMCIRLDCGSFDRPWLTADRDRNLDLLKAMPTGTLVFWDGDVGPKWYGLRASDFEAIGYRGLFSNSYRLEGWFFRLSWRHHGGPRFQEMHLYYK